MVIQIQNTDIALITMTDMTIYNSIDTSYIISILALLAYPMLGHRPRQLPLLLTELLFNSCINPVRRHLLPLIVLVDCMCTIGIVQQ